MQTIICPSLDQLREFSSGYLDDNSAAAIGEHLNHCDACRSAIEQLSQSSDALLAALRERETVPPFGDETDFRRALQFVAAIGHTAASAAPLATVGQTLPVQPQRLREYELLEKLGEGGMGAVYKARHAKLKKLVALKVLPRERLTDAGAVARFEREMEAVGQLDHPHIVRAMDAGEVDGTHFLVMEYVAGIDLAQLVRRLGPLSVREACEIVRQAAIGLQEAHERGMVHRDIKPSNIMLAGVGQAFSLPGKQPVVKILDLGLALLSESHTPDAHNLTSTGQMMGTLDYMAPEQGGDSHQVDIRADIYSLGATLYKLLTGEAIYHGAKLQSPLQKLMALATQAAPSLLDGRPDAPPALAALVARLLAKDPAQRPATPQEVADALAPFAAGADLAALAASVQSAPADQIAGHAQSERSTTSLTAEITDSQPVATRVPFAPPVAAAKPAPARRRNTPAWPLVAAASGGLALMLLGIVLYLQTPDGTIRIETNDDAIKVLVDSRGTTITGTGEPHDITVKSGKHGLRITRGDFTFDTRSFELKRGETTTLKIEFLAGTVQVVKDGKAFDRRDEPKLTANPVQPVPRPLAPAAAPKTDAAPPADREKPFVRLRGGQPAEEFKTLSGAIADLKPGDAIEIHGNGPYQIGITKIEGQGLTLRAAAGYRPRLEMSESVVPVHPTAENVWFTVRGGDLTIEDCDLVGTNHAHWFRHAGGQMSLRRCRLLRCASVGVYESGPGVQMEDCFVQTSNYWGIQAAKAKVEMRNNVWLSDVEVLSVSGGSEVRLRGNTLHTGRALATIHPGEAGLPVRFDLAGNLIASGGHDVRAIFWVWAKDWQPLIEWHAQDNVYAGEIRPPLCRSPGETDWRAEAVAEWEKLLASEPGSRKIGKVEFAWNELQSAGSAAGIDALRTALEQSRAAAGLADFGPDLDRLGPGDAYLTAQREASAQPIPDERLRPEAEEGGPFVLLRAVKVVRGFYSLAEAFAAAASGDEIEIRTDGPRPSSWLPVGKGEITLRAALGYRPVITGDIGVYDKNALSLAGLHVQGSVGSSGGDACIVRVAYCTIDGAVTMRTSEQQPAEVIGSLVPSLTCLQQRGGRVTIRNSIVNQFDLLPVEGESSLVIERSAVWHPGLGMPLYSSQGSANVTAITARSSLFEAGGFLAKSQPLKWAGTSNVYRVGSFRWMAGVGISGLAAWKQQFNSAEEGSLEAEPLIDDPRMWRVTTPELAAERVGADVSGLGLPAAAAESKETTPSGR